MCRLLSVLLLIIFFYSSLCVMERSRTSRVLFAGRRSCPSAISFDLALTFEKKINYIRQALFFYKRLCPKKYYDDNLQSIPRELTRDFEKNFKRTLDAFSFNTFVCCNHSEYSPLVIKRLISGVMDQICELPRIPEITSDELKRIDLQCTEVALQITNYLQDFVSLFSPSQDDYQAEYRPYKHLEDLSLLMNRRIIEELGKVFETVG